MKIEALMNRYYDRLSEIDRGICGYILSHRKSCAILSIDELAQRCNVSATTLFRFAQKLSLPGFGELKARLRWELESDAPPEADALSAVMTSYHKLTEDIRRRDCTVFFDRLYNARRVLICGGDCVEARVAGEFKRIFLPARKLICPMHGDDATASLARLAGAEDIAILISLSGESEPVLRAAERFRLLQTPTVSITGMRSNRLAALCGENFYIRSVSIPISAEDARGYEIPTPYFILIELLFLKYQTYLHDLP